MEKVSALALKYTPMRVEGGGSGWGARVYLWRIHFGIWQNQYNIVKLKKKTKLHTNVFENY